MFNKKNGRGEGLDSDGRGEEERGMCTQLRGNKYKKVLAVRKIKKNLFI